MARLDKIHNAVKNALTKDGWKITHDPYIIEYEEITLPACLAAERTFAAERAGHKIVVEVKSFIGHSRTQDFKLALGQYNLYLGLLELTAPERKLYLPLTTTPTPNTFVKEPSRPLPRDFNSRCWWST